MKYNLKWRQYVMILNKEEKMTKLLEMPNKFHIRKRCTNLQLWDFTNWTSTAENMQHKIIHLFTPLHRGYGSFSPPFYSLSYIFARECWGLETGVSHQHDHQITALTWDGSKLLQQFRVVHPSASTHHQQTVKNRCMFQFKQIRYETEERPT